MRNIINVAWSSHGYSTLIYALVGFERKQHNDFRWGFYEIYFFNYIHLESFQLIFNLIRTVYKLALPDDLLTFYDTPILWNSIALISIIVTELANTMKYGRGVLYKFVFTEFPFKTVSSDVTAFATV